LIVRISLVTGFLTNERLISLNLRESLVITQTKGIY
jgi:hypothetical protein